jgi:uncharacterized protein YgfB (UPF0149 family)
VIPGSATSTLDYDRLRDALADAGAVVALAELHGGACGALCAGGAPAAQRWIADCLDEQPTTAATAAAARDLDELVAASWHGLTSPDLAFTPLLPSDDAPLEEQVQALALWCHGFLGGLGLSFAGDAERRDGAIAEILADFAEISRAGLSDEEAAGRGQPDFALAEIQEYVRVSVQIVFEELGHQRAAATRDSH